jgi:hypothetical protein
MNGSAYLRTSTGEKRTKQYNDKQQDGIIVNFARQIGVYVLYNDEKIIYVGRAIGETSCLFNRLSVHATQDDKQEGWNKFSWFGFCPVDRDKKEITRGTALPEYPAELFVHVLEAILIAAAPSPLNRAAASIGSQYGQWDDYRYMQVK